MSFPWQLAEISVAACLPLACKLCHQKALLSFSLLHILFSFLLDKTIPRERRQKKKKKIVKGGRVWGTTKELEGRNRKNEQRLPLSHRDLIYSAPTVLLKGNCKDFQKKQMFIRLLCKEAIVLNAYYPDTVASFKLHQLVKNRQQINLMVTVIILFCQRVNSINLHPLISEDGTLNCTSNTCNPLLPISTSLFKFMVNLR